MLWAMVDRAGSTRGTTVWRRWQVPPRAERTKPETATSTAGASSEPARTVRTATPATASFARARTAELESRTARELHARFDAAAADLERNFALYSRGDEHITREDLEAVRDGEVAGATQAQRDTAAFLLSSPAFTNALDVGAGKGDVDGKISRGDIEGARQTLAEQPWEGPTIGVDGAVDSREEAMAVLGRYMFLADTASGEGGANSHFSNDDVEALLNDPNIPDELRQAAQYIVDNDVELPGDGSSWWRTATTPIRAAGDAITDGVGGGVSELSEEVRDLVVTPESLDDSERAELMDAARAAKERQADALDLPMNEQHNAHHTNTREEMLAALEGDHQWLEGDVRRDPPVMAHDWQSAGLTLRDWLAIGKESGLGLKLDIKDPESIDAMIEEVRAAGIPEDRLIFNADVLAGPGASGRNVDPEDLEKIREAFPNAIIAIGAKTGGTAEGTTYTEAQVGEMIAIAKRVGGPVMFPLRAELVTPEIVERLSAHGTVAIWNSPSTFPLEDQAAVEEAEQRFRDMGVEGLIDLRTT